MKIGLGQISNNELFSIYQPIMDSQTLCLLSLSSIKIMIPNFICFPINRRCGLHPWQYLSF